MYLIRTKNEADRIVQNIDVLVNSLYKKNGVVGVEMQEELPKDESGLKKLKEEIKRLRILKLVLAFDPPDKMVQTMWEWVKANVGDKIVLDIQIDEKVEGGAEVVFEGKYADLTLRKRWEENEWKSLISL